ncbi:DUF1488 family protein [Kaarinaea lacus]
MRLCFPNPSRSFDASESRVRFWGYDSAIEVLFFIETDALKRLCPEMSSAEKVVLQAFDTARNQIHKVADKVYRHSDDHTFAYILTAKDFKD